MAEPGFPKELLESLRVLEEILPLREDIATTLTKISEVSVRLVPGCDTASVTFVDEGTVSTPGASHEIAIELDQVQYRTESGPCLQAVKEGRTFTIADLETDRRWPEFATAAAASGFRSTLSVPIRIDGITGGLNLYGRSKSVFEDASEELTGLLAARAAIAIENAKVFRATKRLIEQLNEAIKTRELIGEAKGILMAREGLSEDEAFQMLVIASQRANTKLREIAKKIVDDATA